MYKEGSLRICHDVKFLNFVYISCLKVEIYFDLQKQNTCHFLTVYDVSGAGSDRNCVVLNDIHIDIMDYIVPASCDDTEFRQMWAEFEWENKVAVNTNVSDLSQFLQHVIKVTNMRCLTPEKVGTEDFFCGGVKCPPLHMFDQWHERKYACQQE